ncbi:MAG: Bax inhibitor-1/YccA family protein [Alphaproteobacteria bacterium]
MSSDAKNRYGATVVRAEAAIDEGLRQYMLRVYNYMSSGLALTGLVAWLISTSPMALQVIYGNSVLMWVVLLAPLGFVLFLSARINHMSASTAQTVFWVYSGVMGLSLAWIFLAFTGASIARVFFITASLFAAMSLYGYTTKRDLTAIGSFLFMGLIGVVIASVVNIFIASTALQFAVSVIGVIVFTGLTAYDTQSIKEMYVESDSGELAGKKAVMGALRLYLDFINLFLLMLRFLGQQRQ